MQTFLFEYFSLMVQKIYLCKVVRYCFDEHRGRRAKEQSVPQSYLSKK